MLPININMEDFMTAGKEEAEKVERENKQKKTSCSQQALANRLVVGSLPTNPNSEQLQQVPAKQ